ncbi:hypothetical protein BKA61DRAFT_624289 [Leptodontidium sp. MPI-SDFR-AT-0119]|nr:hypothetical protein BKA61DRAFT_624289 [Leptodontidium sp. MPI-SDFR-AT-0119]
MVGLRRCHLVGTLCLLFVGFFSCLLARRCVTAGLFRARQPTSHAALDLNGDFDDEVLEEQVHVVLRAATS